MKRLLVGFLVSVVFLVGCSNAVKEMPAPPGPAVLPPGVNPEKSSIPSAPKTVPAAPIPTPTPMPDTTPPPAPINYTLVTSVSPLGAGSVSPEDGQYEQGTQINLTATASSSYRFISWSGDATGTNPTIMLSMNSSKNVIANFSIIRYNLETSVIPLGGGSISPSSDSNDAGTRVTLTALPSSGYFFDHWDGDVSGESPTITITMDSDKSLVAYFIENAAPSPTLTLLELNTPYIAQSGLTVTVQSITHEQREGFREYVINYMLNNNTVDGAIDEGAFKIYWVDGGGEPQNGLLGRLFPGESVTRSYTWAGLNNQQVLCIEYGADFFAQEPALDTLKWGVPSD
ncbi:hypothetical protein ACFLWB_01930, partial [Chloroflexota bacterium]